MAREQGSGSKLFYYTLSGEFTTFSMRQEMTFRDDVDCEVFTECVEDTLLDFPEFCVRPVIRDERVCYEENRNEPAVFETSGGEETRRYYGTDDTNGFLFYFLCGGKKAAVSYFHGLTDEEGMREFLDCILYRYGQRKGILAEQDLPPAAFSSRCESDMLKEFSDCTDADIDPYGFLTASLGLVPEVPKMPEPAYFIPREENIVNSNRVRVRDVVVPAMAFGNLAERPGFSLDGIVVSAVCRAIARADGLTDETVTASLSVDLRQVYDLDTIANFTDGIFVSQKKEDRDHSFDAFAQAATTDIHEKVGRKHFDIVVAQKVAAVKGLEMMQPISKLKPAPIVALPEGAMTPVTCAVTCLSGKQTFSFMERMDYVCAVSASLSVIAYYAGDQMVIRCIQKSETDSYAKAIADELTGVGLSAAVSDCGYFAGDVLLTEWLNRV